jgi:hypothetical protein
MSGVFSTICARVNKICYLKKFQFADNALPRKHVVKSLNAWSEISRQLGNFHTVVITPTEHIQDAVNGSTLREWPQHLPRQ